MNKRSGNMIFKALLATMLLMGGTAMAQTSHVKVNGSVFGGGNLASVAGNTEVSITQTGAEVVQDVYGGGAFADVGTSATTTHVVNILAGTVSRNVYGGGLGRQENELADDPNTEEVESDPIAAAVYGVVTVNIGSGTENPTTHFANDDVEGSATIVGSVYGCNNANGTPKDNVTVNIWQTAHTSGVDEVGDDGYALSQVFGGGNKAHYQPATANKKTTVHVWTCDNTIQYVYGGGNAADVGITDDPDTEEDESLPANTCVIIDGGRIQWVFGGGNGYSETGNHTHPDQPNYNPGANVYGNVDVTFHAGEITYLFGGSNQYGNVSGLKTVDIPNDNDGCTEHLISKLYGGNNEAPIVGNVGVSLTMPCSANPCPIGYLFGGSRKANISGDVVLTIEGGNYTNVFGGNDESGVIDGNVTLNLFGGTIGSAFGGNNEGGNILGNITVNMLDQGSCPLTVNNIYGGGYNASYTPTPNSGNHPTVNLIHGTVSKSEGTGGNVYGGGYGTSATVTANPVVNVGYNATTMGDLVTGLLPENTSLTTANVVVAGNVYGGGELAPVAGSTTLVVQQATAEGLTASTSVAGDVFGGGDQANVSGSTVVNVTGGTITNDVYGGGALADVNVTTDNNTNTLTPGAITSVTISGGTMGNVYGGGLGRQADANASPAVTAVEAKVYGPVQVTVNSGTVTGAVYGCNNLNGAPQSTVKVDIYGTDAAASGSYALSNVYGGGNLAAYSSTPDVTIHNCDNSIGFVYGGGNKASVVGTNVVVYGGNTIGHVFAGGNGLGVAANYTMVSGDTHAYIYGGTIGKVFGGNNNSGAIAGTLNVTVDKQAEGENEACDMHITEVYSGGNLAASNAGSISVNCTGGEGEGIEYLYGGARDADVTGPIELNIVDGQIQNVFGGNNVGHTVSGAITVNINKEASPCGWYIGNVYGGGNQATYGSANSNYPQVNILNGLVSGDVFGGGLGDADDDTKGVVTGNPQVTVNGANASVAGGVYGGGSLAPTAGNPVVTLTNGALTNVFGGGKAASVTGAPTVQIDGGSVSTGIYGGCHEQGNVSGNITVNVHGGTIGTETNLNLDTPVVAQVFGGGYGNGTSTSGNVEVNIGNATAGPAIYGDVYGGSALGNVNTQGGSNTTTVNIMNGTLYTNRQNGTNVLEQTCYIYHGGNVFGGGLGRKANPSATPPVTAIEAKVYGDVTVNIGTGTVTNGYTPSSNTGYATIKGSIFGCNDQNGAPQKSVTVNVFATAHTTTDSYDYDPTENNNVPATYALANVFGGSRQADFLTGVIPLVNIYGCDNTIERTFGGCDAAESNSVETMIQGGHVHQAYGGGNGEISPANVDGDVTIGIHGGKVDSSFGGSNLQGEISGTSTISTDAEGGCGETHIEEQFGGGNFADVHGNVDAIFRCADGLFIENLYGGCKQADVLPNGAQIGNVHLVVEGGTYNNIFGGSQGRLPGTNGDDDPGKSADISGCILLEIHGGKVNNAIYGGSHILGKVNGTITVNIENMNTGCDLDVSTADVYGGGNEANYDTAPTQGENGYDYTHPNYPVINIKNATVRNVFGGGYKAEVKGNPQIHLKKGAKVLGNVYGGGNMGEVVGNPKVNVDGNDESANPHSIPNSPQNE